MFLSMVAAPPAGPPTRRPDRQNIYVQRYNVAASRAKDQLWLFHSVSARGPQQPRRHALRPARTTATASSTAPTSRTIESSPPPSPRTYGSSRSTRSSSSESSTGSSTADTPSSRSTRPRATTSTSSSSAPRRRLAIECDGDAWHGPDAYEADLARQRDLERCGWQFFRIRESAFYVDQAGALENLWRTLDELEIHPSGWVSEDLSDDDEDEDTWSEETAASDEIEADIEEAWHSSDFPEPPRRHRGTS